MHHVEMAIRSVSPAAAAVRAAVLAIAIAVT
jgi:hypothetical protein